LGLCWASLPARKTETIVSHVQNMITACLWRA
jgi:hypothetical protein